VTPSLRSRAALVAGRAAGAATRRLGRGGGTALPGLVAGAIAPDLLEELATDLPHGLVTVTGTNGKTTTAHLLSAILTRAGLDPLANRAGSNLERGLVAAYVGETDRTGDLDNHDQRIGVFEVDEAALPPLFAELQPRLATFLNLFRDQLDRYGEVDSVATGWHRMLAEISPETALVLNADDPNIALLGTPEDQAGRPPDALERTVTTFGVDDPEVALHSAEHASDARFCPNGNRYRYDAVYMGHVGIWYCDCCGRRRPNPDVSATRVLLESDRSIVTLSIGGSEAVIELPLSGLYTVYNALAAAATAHALGIEPDVIAAALSEAGAPFGRQERFQLGDRTVRILLAKNPAGLNEVMRTLAASDGALTVLAMLNDGIQDGQDVSWIYDADLELLTGRRPTLVAAGDRADDFALRWHLAGIEPQAVVHDTEAAVDLALEATRTGQRLDVVATYTAMLEVRAAFARRAGVGAYWERPTAERPAGGSEAADHATTEAPR
jgi:UDP-N-acetylmuramyl tripeptide synthase